MRSSLIEPLVPVDPSTLNAEQLDELKQRAGKADEHWERLMRTAADFENYKKRSAREKQEAIKFANESLLEKLIPVLDTFDMALAAAQNNQADQSLQTGISMVQQQLKNALAAAGLEELDATGKAFDPNLHEAVTTRPADHPGKDHTVGAVLQPGYQMRGALIRPARVVVLQWMEDEGRGKREE